MDAKRNSEADGAAAAQSPRRSGGRGGASAEAKKNGRTRVRGGIEDFYELAREMREGGWDDTYYRQMRGLPPREESDG